ncbi:MAG: hypothetical protein AAFP84_06800, partial [Actinomycetota bacterium]
LNFDGGKVESNGFDVTLSDAGGLAIYNARGTVDVVVDVLGAFVPAEAGAPGKDGKDGAPGEQGPQGPAGEKGDKGDPGEGAGAAFETVTLEVPHDGLAGYYVDFDFRGELLVIPEGPGEGPGEEPMDVPGLISCSDESLMPVFGHIVSASEDISVDGADVRTGFQDEMMPVFFGPSSPIVIGLDEALVYFEGYFDGDVELAPESIDIGVQLMCMPVDGLADAQEPLVMFGDFDF